MHEFDDNDYDEMTGILCSQKELKLESDHDHNRDLESDHDLELESESDHDLELESESDHDLELESEHDHETSDSKAEQASSPVTDNNAPWLTFGDHIVLGMSIALLFQTLACILIVLYAIFINSGRVYKIITSNNPIELYIFTGALLAFGVSAYCMVYSITT